MAYRKARSSYSSRRRTVARGGTRGRQPARRKSVSRRTSSRGTARRSSGGQTIKLVIETAPAAPDYSALYAPQATPGKRKGKF